MALDVQYISLDISKQPTPQQVRLGQGDANATQLVVSIFDDGIAYDLDSYSVRLETRLPNSDTYYSVDGTRSGNVATFDIDETYAATSYGFDGFGYVDILSGDTVICSTSRFQLVVLQNAQEGADPSTAYSNGIIEATERAIAAAEAAEGVVLQDVPLMSTTIRGGAQLGTGLEITDGVLSVDSATVPIPTMSATTKGGAKLGSGLSVANDTLSLNLPTMGASTKGGAKLGSGLAIANDVLSLDSHTHNASDITSGEIPIAHGGTGATTAAAALTALGAASQDDMDDAEQAIADNAAAIATLRESVSPRLLKETTTNGITIKAHQSAYVVVVSWTGQLTTAVQDSTWFLSLFNLPAPLFGDMLWQPYFVLLGTERYDFRIESNGTVGMISRGSLSVGARVRGSFAYVATLP